MESENTPSYRLLLVDDDRILSPLVEEYLQARGYETRLFHEPLKGFSAFRTEEFDLCIFDVKMPVKDGFTLAREIHALSPETPFLFLTHESEKEKRIEGLKLGAEDYILKPFSMEELYLRVKRILKRAAPKAETAGKSHPEAFRVGQFNFDPGSRELSSRGKSIHLSDIEARLLQMFCEAPNGFVDRQHALKRIWNDEHMVRTRSLNTYMSKLRKYLEADPNIRLLNVHGSGYRLAVSGTTPSESPD